MFKLIPNLLTAFRISVIPLIVITFYIPGVTMRWVAAVLFLLACISDFFDGYLARAWELQSNLGKFLDPIADKLLVVSVLVMLIYDHNRADIIPALAIILREITVSGLREFLADLHVPMPVSRLGKWKTTLQMLSLGLLLWGAEGSGFMITEYIGRIALWLAAGLTLYSGYAYLKAGLEHIKKGG